MQAIPYDKLPDGNIYGLIIHMDINDIRLTNIRSIIFEQFHNVAGKFAEHIGRQPAYVYRLFTENEQHKRSVGEKLARSIEEKCNKPRGWLDIDHSESGEITPEDGQFIHKVGQEIGKYEVPDHIKQTILTLISSSPPRDKN